MTVALRNVWRRGRLPVGASMLATVAAAAGATAAGLASLVRPSWSRPAGEHTRVTALGQRLGDPGDAVACPPGYVLLVAVAGPQRTAAFVPAGTAPAHPVRRAAASPR